MGGGLRGDGVRKRANLVEQRLVVLFRPLGYPLDACAERVISGGCLVERTQPPTRLHTRAIRLGPALRAGGTCSRNHRHRWIRSPNGRRKLSRRSGLWQRKGGRAWRKATRCQRSAQKIHRIGSHPACHQICPRTCRILRRAPLELGHPACPMLPLGINSAEIERLTIGTIVRAPEGATLCQLLRLVVLEGSQ